MYRKATSIEGSEMDGMKGSLPRRRVWLPRAFNDWMKKALEASKKGDTALPFRGGTMKEEQEEPRMLSLIDGWIGPKCLNQFDVQKSTCQCCPARLG